jgi:hypothetical protein
LSAKQITKEDEQRIYRESSDMVSAWAWLEAETRPRKINMTYYIRRMNKVGHWLTIDSTDIVPPFGWENFLKLNYGPGRFNVARVERGLAGMQSLGTYNIGYEHQ